MAIGGDSSDIDERISRYEQIVDDLKNECARAELLFERLKRKEREIQRMLESKDVRALVKDEVGTAVNTISTSLTKEKIAETVITLDKVYPNGWRSGDELCDSMTVLLFNGIREFGKSLVRT